MTETNLLSQVDVYAVGLIALSACAPADMSVERVTAAVNLRSPTGISSNWSHSPDSFAGGKTNPCVCEQDSSRRHYLFQC